MSQFIRLNKITTRGAASDPILFNKSEVLTVDEETLLAPNGSQFLARRIVLNGNPDYTFHTTVSKDNLLSGLGAVDLTGTLTIGGSSCNADPGVLDIVTLDATFPLMHVRKVVNNIATQTSTMTFNPNFIIHALEHPYQDEDTEVQALGLMIALRGLSTKRYLVALTMDELTSLLDPVIIT